MSAGLGIGAQLKKERSSEPRGEGKPEAFTFLGFQHGPGLWGSFIPDYTPVYPDACAPSRGALWVAAQQFFTASEGATFRADSDDFCKYL